MAAETPVCDFGRKAADFRLKGVDGKDWSLADARGPRGTLVMFICNHCPYVKAVIGRIVREATALKAHGIGCVAIMSNDTVSHPEDGVDAMARFAEQHGFPFPYLLDETQAVARAYGAVCTPDFFGYNAADELQYRGRLDASRTQLVPDAPRELYHAMVCVAESGHGPADQIPSMGCGIKWRDPA